MSSVLAFYVGMTTGLVVALVTLIVAVERGYTAAFILIGACVATLLCLIFDTIGVM